MCKYCESEERYNFEIQGKYKSNTQAKILSYWQLEKKKKRKTPPMLIVMDHNPSGESSVEYVRQISYCPWCGEQLSDESYIREGL